jgi:hypothetical protein
MTTTNRKLRTHTQLSVKPKYCPTCGAYTYFAGGSGRFISTLSFRPYCNEACRDQDPDWEAHTTVRGVL